MSDPVLVGCPYCCRWFATLRGLGVHVSRWCTFDGPTAETDAYAEVAQAANDARKRCPA